MRTHSHGYLRGYEIFNKEETFYLRLKKKMNSVEGTGESPELKVRQVPQFLAETWIRENLLEHGKNAHS